MMASAAWRQPLAAADSARSPRMRVILACGSGSPMTPVDARNTSCGRQPKAPAAASATLRVPSSPAFPVKAFALPLFTTSARAAPEARHLVHHSTGADAVLDLVKTPAACVPGASAASNTSVRSRYLIPACPVAKRTPASGGSDANFLGASGETAWPGAALAAVGLALLLLRAPRLFA